MSNYSYWAHKLHYWFLLPGIMIHEFAHAFIVWNLPNVRITDMSLKSHVFYEGHLTATRSTIISYAPVIINTSIAYLLFRYIYLSGPIESTFQIMISFIGLLLAGSIAMSSLPSFEDAISPLRLLRQQLFTIKFPIVLLIGPIVLLLSAPIIVITYLQHKFYSLQVILSFLWMVLVLEVATDTQLFSMFYHLI